MTWVVCEDCDIKEGYSYLRLTEDGEIRCAECLKKYTRDTWQDDRIDELLDENRKLTRDLDRLLTLKWGLQWDTEEIVGLEELRQRMAEINQHADQFPQIDELNDIYNRLMALVERVT